MGILRFAPVEICGTEGECNAEGGNSEAMAANRELPGIAAANKPVPPAARNFRRSKEGKNSGRFNLDSRIKEPPFGKNGSTRTRRHYTLGKWTARAKMDAICVAAGIPAEAPRPLSSAHVPAASWSFARRPPTSRSPALNWAERKW